MQNADMAILSWKKNERKYRLGHRFLPASYYLCKPVAPGHRAPEALEKTTHAIFVGRPPASHIPKT